MDSRRHIGLWPALALPACAAGMTLTSFAGRWKSLWEAVRHPILFVQPDVPYLRYALAGTFLWWLLVGLGAWLLWRRRGRPDDVAWVLGVALASAAMFFFYNQVMAFSQNGPGVPWAVGWPIVMCRDGYRAVYGLVGRDWVLPGVALNFAFRLAALTAPLLVLRVAVRKRASQPVS